MKYIWRSLGHPIDDNNKGTVLLLLPIYGTRSSVDVSYPNLGSSDEEINSENLWCSER